MKGTTCQYDIVDKAYGGVPDLTSVITGCRVGTVVWAGDVKAWQAHPLRYHCTHCGKKIELKEQHHEEKAST